MQGHMRMLFQFLCAAARGIDTAHSKHYYQHQSKYEDDLTSSIGSLVIKRLTDI